MRTAKANLASKNDSGEFKAVGFEFSSASDFQSGLADFMTGGGWNGDDPLIPPSPARAVFADDNGDTFVGLPTEDGIVPLPFMPGSKASIDSGHVSEKGGFVPMDEMPARGGGGGLQEMLGGMAGQLPAQAANWLGNAAAQAMLGGAAGGGLDSVLATLGVTNPVASGPVGAAMKTALGAAGLGPMGNVLGSMLSGGGADALAQSVGGAGLNSLLSSAGLGGVPGLGALGSMAGGQAGGALADLVTTGGFAGPLDDAAASLGGLLGGDDVAADVMNETLGGCFPSGDEMADAASGIGADSLNKAADQLLDQWQVDDESSAAEHVAHKAVNDNKDKIKGAVSDPDGFMDKVNGFFSGEAPGAGMPAVRITDLDDGADISTMGVATILFESMPVSRITDMVLGPKAPAPTPILEGAATVLSAELPTAFVSAKTAVPSTLVSGAAKILVGGAVASISPPDSAENAKTSNNDGPAGPDSPEGPSSASGGSDGQADGGDGSCDQSDSEKTSTAEQSAENSEKANSEKEQDNNAAGRDRVSDGGDSEGQKAVELHAQNNSNEESGNESETNTLALDSEDSADQDKNEMTAVLEKEANLKAPDGTELKSRVALGETVESDEKTTMTAAKVEHTVDDGTTKTSVKVSSGKLEIEKGNVMNQATVKVAEFEAELTETGPGVSNTTTVTATIGELKSPVADAEAKSTDDGGYSVNGKVSTGEAAVGVLEVKNQTCVDIWKPGPAHDHCCVTLKGDAKDGAIGVSAQIEGTAGPNKSSIGIGGAAALIFGIEGEVALECTTQLDDPPIPPTTNPN